MSEMEKLIRQRSALKSKLTIFSNFLQNIQGKEEVSDLELIQLNDRLTRIEKLIEEFDELQNLIVSQAEDLESQFKERETFETNYFNNISIAKKFLMIKDQ
ncbi:hypothetical protein NQ314_020942 [Rhamnusium bicolor]|uniref:Uncharacterized protein n=1 Tax=Rhamnusium bicolor TaxID=1586634 RepID=A0AAV8WJK1_9CUCU|nr:hypothetical protein NQ314_020942 [Rhamnusium bicolor]